MMTLSIAKVITELGNELFLLVDYVDQKELRVQILNVKDFKAYCGRVTDIELRSMAAELRMAFNSYMKETLNAFTITEVKPQYVYTLDNNGDKHTLKWKKRIENDDIKIHLGEIIVEQKDFKSVLSDVLLILSSEISNGSTKSSKLHAKLQESEKKIEHAHVLLNEALEVKEQLEKELYAKFTIILNNKKRKIRELYEMIENLKSVKKPKKEKLQQNDMSNENHLSKEDYASGPGPSNYRKKSHTSLLLSDEQDILPPKQHKLRMRQKVSSQKANGSAPLCSTATQRKAITRHLSESDDDIDAMLENI